MLSSPLPCREIIEGVVVMDSTVDNEDAFNMCVEYLYTSSYVPPANLGFETRCILHARVYVLAERLCMESLKNEAVRQLEATIWGLPNGFGFHAPPRLSPETLLDMISIIYDGTPAPSAVVDPPPEDAPSDSVAEPLEPLAEEVPPKEILSNEIWEQYARGENQPGKS
jgi:hypothetical protein